MIDTEALRKKVIDLAIQGKLTVQLRSDGDAETLYAQIQNQKQQLIKEGKLKKDKALPDIAADEIPFEIPANWKWVRLGDLCLQITDGTHRTPTYQSDGIPFLSVKNISSGAFDLTDIKYISEEEHSELIKRCKPEKNDVLVCRIGTLGKAITIDIDLEFSIFVSLGLIKTTEKTISDYIVQVINSGYGDKWIKDNKAGGAMHTYKINLNSLALLPVPLAPISEIERILYLKDEVKTHIETIYNLQSKYSNDLAVLKCKIIDAGIRGKLTEQLPEDGDAEDLYAQIQEEKTKQIKEGKIKKEKPFPEIVADEVPFEIPKNWKWVRLNDISDSIWAGGDKPADFTKEKDVEHSVPVVANGVSDEGILGYTSEAKAKRDTLTVAGRGTIGFTVHRRYDYCPIVRLVVVEPSKYVEPSYLCYVLKALPAGSVGSSIPQLTVPMIKPKLIPLPPLLEQKRIIRRLEEVFNSEVFECGQ